MSDQTPNPDPVPASDPAAAPADAPADQPGDNVPVIALDDPAAAPTAADAPPPEGDPAAPLDDRQPVNADNPGREPGGADDPNDDEVVEVPPVNPQPGDPVLGSTVRSDAETDAGRAPEAEVTQDTSPA